MPFVLKHNVNLQEWVVYGQLDMTLDSWLRGWLNSLGPLRKALPLVGAQGYQRFPLSKPVIRQNITAFCACFTLSFYLPSFCLPGSFNFIFPKLLTILSEGMCIKS